MQKYQDFQSFYVFYLSQHKHPVCRLLHVVGTFMALAWIVYSLVFGQFSILPLFLLWGYGLSWIGHFFFERNTPAAFKQPLYSFRGDLKMCFEVLSFQRGLTDK
jgi:hypothetical protein